MYTDIQVYIYISYTYMWHPEIPLSEHIHLAGFSGATYIAASAEFPGAIYIYQNSCSRTTSAKEGNIEVKNLQNQLSIQCTSQNHMELTLKKNQCYARL